MDWADGKMIESLFRRQTERLIEHSDELGAIIMGAVQDLQAAAGRIESEAGQTGVVVVALRAAVVALQEQVAQDQVDSAAIAEITASLSSAADTLDAQGNDPAAPPAEPEPEPAPDEPAPDEPAPDAPPTDDGSGDPAPVDNPDTGNVGDTSTPDDSGTGDGTVGDGDAPTV